MSNEINLILESISGEPFIYLNRHMHNRLTLWQLEKLPIKKIKAYNKKYKHLRYCFNHQTYRYSTSDLRHNSYWWTNINVQFSNYFSAIYKIIKEKEKNEI